MRIALLKNLKEKYVNMLKYILSYEEKYGSLNYYSRISSNGIAWSINELGIEISRGEINYLLKRGLLERIRKGVYHINPSVREALREELGWISVDLDNNIDIENALRYVIHSDRDARAILNLAKFNKKWKTIYDDVGWDLKKAKEIVIGVGADLSVLNRMRESGLLIEVNSGEFLFNDFDLSLLDPYLESSFSTKDAVHEFLHVVIPMRNLFREFVSNITKKDLEEIKDQIKNIEAILKYSRHVMGSLYMDMVLPIIQQYGLADVPIYSDKGRKITQTGFSLAYFGEPGTGKTFATDDIIRGNERDGVPPHGIIGRIRYAEGMTPKKFIAILEAYQNYPVDWVIPEFNDFFRYRGMVEKLKLVMEHREVSDETKKDVIYPYKVTSFFIVNYNTKIFGSKWNVTVEDPNFNALEDRMICKIFINDELRERMIYENMIRKVNGDIDWFLSESLQKHLTYSYYYYSNTNTRLIINSHDFVRFGDKIRELRKNYRANLSNRIILKGLQIAGSAALVKGVGEELSELYISWDELSLALNFIKDEIKTRSMRYN